MKLNIKSVAAVLAISVASVASAQNLQSAYFTDGYLYRYQSNPAFDNERNFIAMPALGNLNLGVKGTLSLDDVLYNVDGKTTTFLNPAVDANEFLNAIGDNSRFGSDFKVGILAAGFKAFKGYNTISLNVRGNLNSRIPTTFMRLLKEGVQNKTYDISDLSMHADAYAELALGHSHKINEKLRIGGALKFLVGAGNVDAEFDQAHLTLGENSWDIVVEGQLQSSIKNLAYKHDINNNTKHEYVDGMDFDEFGVNGFGVAVDLGAEYKLNNDWSFSAAVLDLGFINWSNNMLASTNGVKSFTTDSYTFNVDDEATNNFDDELDLMRDDLTALYELEDMGDQGARSKMLAATINVAAQYTLPVYRNLKFGLLNTTRLQGDYTWTEFRLSANVNPVKAFSAGANFAAGTYGCAFGWVMNVNVPGFNFFVGMDHLITKLSKQGVPLTSKADLSLGINFPF